MFAAVYPAIATEPNELTDDCNSTFEKLITVLCIPAGTPTWNIWIIYFLFIFNSDNKEEVQEKMNEIQRDVEDLGKRLNLPLSVSVGISVFKPNDNWNEKRQEADEASYYHKRKTKSNRI